MYREGTVLTAIKTSLRRAVAMVIRSTRCRALRRKGWWSKKTGPTELSYYKLVLKR